MVEVFLHSGGHTLYHARGAELDRPDRALDFPSWLDAVELDRRIELTRRRSSWLDTSSWLDRLEVELARYVEMARQSRAGSTDRDGSTAGPATSSLTERASGMVDASEVS